MKPFVPLSTLLTIFNALAQPHFNYCNVVWGNCSSGLCDKLQKRQNREACVLLDASYDSSSESLREIRTPMKGLRHQLLFDRAVTVLKSLNNLAPEYVCSKVIPRNELVNSFTRS